MPSEKIRLRIGNLAKAVLVTGQAYQDPKDALNEFVSNAADEYAESGERGALIRVVLRRRGRYPLIAIEDFGRGMDAQRLRDVARSLFESPKAGDPRTLGEKAIGILAFQQLGGCCDIVTCPSGARRTLALRLQRGRSFAELSTNERRRARQRPGTSVYIYDLDPEVLRVLTQWKIITYLRRRRAVALARGDYIIQVVEGRKSEIVTPEEPDGIRLAIPARTTRFGRIEFYLYISPSPDKRRRVAIVGAAGTTIVDDITEIDEFDASPWNADQISGQIAYEGLKQTAGRRAVLRDRESFPSFVAAVKAVEPLVIRTLEQVTEEVADEIADQLADAVRKIFGRVLKELEDVDNPMRSRVGSEQGDGALLVEKPGREPGRPLSDEMEDATFEPPAPPPTPVPEPERPPSAQPEQRTRRLPSIAPDPTPDGTRSRFDEEQGIVYYNDRHPDYLLVKSDQSALLDYLATLVAKEYVLYNNPRTQPQELGEEMVRMLVRVRRYMPRKAYRS